MSLGIQCVFVQVQMTTSLMSMAPFKHYWFRIGTDLYVISHPWQPTKSPHKHLKIYGLKDQH